LGADRYSYFPLAFGTPIVVVFILQFFSACETPIFDEIEVIDMETTLLPKETSSKSTVSLTQSSRMMDNPNEFYHKKQLSTERHNHKAILKIVTNTVDENVSMQSDSSVSPSDSSSSSSKQKKSVSFFIPENDELPATVPSVVKKGGSGFKSKKKQPNQPTKFSSSNSRNLMTNSAHRLSEACAHSKTTEECRMVSSLSTLTLTIIVITLYLVAIASVGKVEFERWDSDESHLSRCVRYVSLIISYSRSKFINLLMSFSQIGSPRLGMLRIFIPASFCIL
jgi:hypothetical protein